MGDSSSKSLCEAVAAGDLEKCQEELEDLAKKEPDEKWDVNEPDEAGRTAFQNAAYFGYESIIKLLVEHGESNVHTAELITPGGGDWHVCIGKLLRTSSWRDQRLDHLQKIQHSEHQRTNLTFYGLLLPSLVVCMHGPEKGEVRTTEEYKLLQRSIVRF